MTNSSTIGSKPKVAAASRRSVSAYFVDSLTLASKTPAQAPQTHNVRKCPVLSGPTDLFDVIDASTDKQTTCAGKTSHPDRTLTRHGPSSRTSPLPSIVLSPPRPTSPTSMQPNATSIQHAISIATSLLFPLFPFLLLHHSGVACLHAKTHLGCGSSRCSASGSLHDHAQLPAI